MTTVWRPVRRTLPDLLDWAERIPEALAMANRPPAEAVHGMRVEEFVDDGTYTVRAELPGVDPEKDITVEIDNGIMAIRAERKEETHERGSTEFHYGRFERRVVLPEGADENQITARYDAGVLEVRVPVREQRVEPRAIPVQRGQSREHGEGDAKSDTGQESEAGTDESPG